MLLPPQRAKMVVEGAGKWLAAGSAACCCPLSREIRWLRVQECGLQRVLWHVLAPSAIYNPRSGRGLGKMTGMEKNVRDWEKRRGMEKNVWAGRKEKPAGIALPVFL